MTIRLHDLAPAPGTRKKGKRVGRGVGGKGGKTAGRGTKGQHARNTVRPQFEGGQLPMVQRTPKLHGFKNPFRIEYVVINLSALETLEETEIDPGVLRRHGLIPKKGFVKVLGDGTLSKKLTVKAHRFSKSAEQAITTAGGTIEVLPKPYKVRPAASGNALMNR
jgi:large subunit ribosomal protein L15